MNGSKLPWLILFSDWPFVLVCSYLEIEYVRKRFEMRVEESFNLKSFWHKRFLTVMVLC